VEPLGIPCDVARECGRDREVTVNLRQRTGRRAALTAGPLSLLLLAAACGGSSGTGTGANNAANNGTGGSDIVAQAKAAVEANYKGQDRPLPASGPKAQSGKNIWVISCTQAGPGCAIPAAGVKAAGEAIGWKVTVFDGKGLPDVYAQGIRTAITQHADAIVLDVVDCVAAQAALKEAKAAGVKLYSFYSFDCDDSMGGGGSPLFDASLNYQSGMSYAALVEDVYSKSIADYVIAKTDGQAKVIEFTEDDIIVGKHLYLGFEKELAKCGGCKVVKKVPFTLTDLTTGKLPAKTSAALTQHPEANVVYGLYDAALTLGISQAVIQSGRNAQLIVTGGEGLPPNIQAIQGGKGQTMAAGSASQRVGWAAVDGLIRLFAGQPQVDEGLGIQTMDKDHNMPTDPPFYDGNVGPDGKRKVDYETAYKQLWGAG
jgi:ribose transport system substrate-binding protein